MKIKLYILSFLVLSICSCEKYLDRQSDDALTEADLFKTEANTLASLMNTYTYMPYEAETNGMNHPFNISSDEGSSAYPSRGFAYINQDLWTTSANNYYDQTYTPSYKGIRAANYFMLHVNESPITDDQKKIYYNEARFLRAYYYFLLMRSYGPVILIGNNPVDFTSDNLSKVDRAPWDSCLNYVVSELDAVAGNLPDNWGASFSGRATKGAAMAVKARLMLYAARPLFNGCKLYSSMTNKFGQHLFPAAPDMNKWQEAAAASKAIIDLNKYKLVGQDESAANNYNAYTYLKNLFLTRTVSNSEFIFTEEVSAYGERRNTVPQTAGGYGGVGATQKMVDGFAMSNGRYPITGYTNNGATPIIDKSSGYTETGFTTITHPVLGKAVNVSTMYQNRDPRFYMDIFWSGLPWIDAGGARTIAEVQYNLNGNSGPGTSNNYPPTGYTPFKFIDLSIKYGIDDWGTLSYPLFRYAEVLLNYVEALNEYDPNNADIITYLNLIRRRAGIPGIEVAYPEAVGNQVLMRELIRKERFVELCFENQRYFDTRTWMTAPVENSGPVYGLNVWNTDDKVNGPYWQRTVVKLEAGFNGVRVFTPRCYLFPFKDYEIVTARLTQNYGW
ncbi:RagB/SusD family nutrient uptake outer membrane protein [Chitinophaga sp. Cy-1792]|uniref:RagB/SusD family nutrient uptake outer membrane protein n=1 Tax=Chitinophaga sp. Cy-1792 TaxID=2608339 RepID=UPI0014234B73|nr:RagB/SusD family nutrient uptake outer membrane protein [Chitinophaga sp. Cy-1792]NIG53262.1 RagB/SusD family nutrient uptake outer membrane protein [Chitinophaga sp. Cy-1792]